MSRTGDAALELWVLLRRALEEGYLDVDELLGSYVAVAPSTHSRLADERHVDLEAVVDTLEALPRGLLDAPQVLVVPDLAGFLHTPIGPDVGVLEDGTLLFAAPLGPASAAELAARLCLLEHEVAKARDLLPEPLMTEDREEIESAANEDDATDALAHETETDVDAHEAAILDETVDLDATVVADRDETTEPTLSTEDDSEASPDLLSHVAFAWGTDPMTLAGANQATDNAVLRLMAGGEPLPPVYLHASLGREERRRRGQRDAERIASLLAEAGYLTRAVHLWVGPGGVTDCLSPYCRDLREALRAWALQRAPEAYSPLGEDLHQPSQQPGEDELYAIAHDFIRTDPRLPQERDAAERTVGLSRYRLDGFSLETIDLGRIDLDLCDARLHVGTIPSPAPILLRLDSDPSDPDAFLLRSLFEMLGPTIASVTIVLEGSVLRGPPGTVVQPHMMIRWAGEQKIAPPATSPFEPEELNGYATGPLQRGAVLAIPSAMLLNRSHLDEMRSRYDVAAINVGGDGLVDALNDALWAGTLGPEPQAGWVVVGSERVSTGRLSVTSQAGTSAVAVARLRALLAPPAPAPAPTRQPDPPRRSTRPAIRIKA